MSENNVQLFKKYKKKKEKEKGEKGERKEKTASQIELRLKKRLYLKRR